MLKLKSIHLLFTASVLATACGEAKFSGENPSRAQNDPNAPKNPSGLSCVVAPARLSIGEKALITVTSASPVASLQQAIVLTDQRILATLKSVDGQYKIDGDKANEAVAAKDGVHTVELRLDAASQRADATCEFTVVAGGSNPPTGDTPAGNTSTGQTPAGAPGTGSGSTGGGTGGGTPAGTGGGTTPPPECKETDRAIGAQIAFIIDNSKSHEGTDCVRSNTPYETETYGDNDPSNDQKLYQCLTATNREKAVMAAFDVLKQVSDKDPNNALGKSRLSVAMFPTRSDRGYNSWSKVSDWIDINGSTRGGLANAMQFTRKPYGMTPYGAGIDSALDLFKSSIDDQRAKVVVLVTDGLPTDQSALRVKAKADILRANGVQVVTVFVTGSGDYRSAHVDYLRDLNSNWSTNLKRNYYEEHPSFDSWVNALIGGAGQASLAQRVSNKVVEVRNSAALQDAFMQIVKTEAIRCER